MPQAPEGLSDLVEHAPGWITEKDVHEIMEYLAHGAPEVKRPERKPVTGSEALFRERCSGCHTGGGQGPPGALAARPRATHGCVPCSTVVAEISI